MCELFAAPRSAQGKERGIGWTSSDGGGSPSASVQATAHLRLIRQLIRQLIRWLKRGWIGWGVSLDETYDRGVVRWPIVVEGGGDHPHPIGRDIEPGLLLARRPE